MNFPTISRSRAIRVAAIAILAASLPAQNVKPRPKRILAIVQANGFQHDAVSTGMATMWKLGRETGLWDTYIRTDTQLITKKKLSGNASARADFSWSLAVGLAAGWATVTEYPAAPASAILALLALSQAWPRGRAARWRVTAGVGVGAFICLTVLLAYLHAAFGSFRPSYSYYDPNSFSFMQQQGYMGLTYPHPDRLLKLLFGCSRGLFFYCSQRSGARVIYSLRLVLTGG